MFSFLLLGRGEVQRWSLMVAGVAWDTPSRGDGGDWSIEAFTSSQESCDSLKHFATASSSQHTAGDLVKSNKRRFFPKDLAFIKY